MRKLIQTYKGYKICSQELEGFFSYWVESPQGDDLKSFYSIERCKLWIDKRVKHTPRPAKRGPYKKRKDPKMALTNLEKLSGIRKELESAVDLVKAGGDIATAAVIIAACKHALQTHAIEIAREKLSYVTSNSIPAKV